MPLVHVWDVGLTDEQKVKIPKGIADTYKEANPMLKVHEELLWVVFHFGPLNVSQLRQKLRSEKK